MIFFSNFQIGSGDETAREREKGWRFEGVFDSVRGNEKEREREREGERF